MADRMELMLEAERRGILPPRQAELLGEARRRGLVPGGAPAEAVEEQPGGAPAEAVEEQPESAITDPLLAEADEPERFQTRDELFGLEPEKIARRGFLFPTGTTKEGEFTITPSDMMLEAMDAITAFKRVTEGGQATPEEALMIAGMITPGVPQGTQRLIRAGRGLLPARETAERVASETAEAAAEATAREAADTGGILSRRIRSTGVPASELRDVADDAAAQARRARFEDLDIPATRGDVTQDFAAQADEARLASMAGDPNAEPLRQLRLQQSQAFETRTGELVDSLGVPDETGQRVKDALSGRIKLLRSEKNKLYKEVADASPELANAPLITDDIVLAIPDRNTTIRIEELAPGQVRAVDRLMVQFGMFTDPAAVKAFTDKGGEVTPLTLGNFDNFRIGLNQIERSDQSDAIKVITGPIKRALDEEATFIDQAVRESGITDQSVVNTLREARQRVRTLKTEFSPQAIAGRLTGTRRDGFTPVIEASRVSNELLRPGAPIENLERTLTSLRNSGKKGAQAIGDLQATVVADALEAALKAPSRKTSGIETIGGNQFAKALDKFGDDKLDLLFANNRAALNRLRDLRQTGLDMTPSAAASPKGSAPVILDKVLELLPIPMVSLVKAAARGVSASDARAGARAVKPMTPAFRRSVANFVRQYPGLSARLGLAGAAAAIPDEPTQTLEDLADTA